MLGLQAQDVNNTVEQTEKGHSIMQQASTVSYEEQEEYIILTLEPVRMEEILDSARPEIRPVELDNFVNIETMTVEEQEHVEALRVEEHVDMETEEPEHDDMETVTVENENQGEQRGRKRQRNPDSWKINIKKRLRISGQSYANGKNINVPARKVKEKDCATCRYKCNSNFPEPERQNIFDQFWSMADVSRQKDFIINHTVTTIKKRQTTQTESKRKNSIKYRLTTQGNQIRTCKDFFLKTLDITEKFARSALDGQSSINLGISPPSTHGKHAPANKISEERKNLIRNHINSFPTIESHYCRKATTRQYLGENLNISKMYDLYVSKCNNEWEVSAEKISLYRHIFNTEFNLGFHQPTKDACKYCEWFKGLNDHEKEVNLEEYNAHQNRKTQARDQKEEDKRQAQQESTFMAVTFDLEQVLTTPWSNVSSLFYSRKLSTYNLTVYELGSKTANCYMWHEGEGGRGSCEISTCVFRYLSSLSSNIDHVVLYSDTCGGQNRNAGFSAMCLHAVKDLPISIIDHKFMESGHSQMECDSVHAAIETARKNVPVYSPQGYYTLVRMARKTKPYEVIELGHADFLDFKSLSQQTMRNKTKDSEVGSVRWQKIKWMRYTKENPRCIQFKYEMSEEFHVLEVGKQETRGSHAIEPKKLNNSPPGISALKKRDLLTLCTNGSIPSSYLDFYQSLKASE